ncbi:MAG: glycoside hydrolase family 95 protein, partial [Clostridia bacterium]
ILNYSTPADYSNKGWQDSVLPIGNGYMGMCVFGGINKEVLQFNEKTLWQGGPSPQRPNYNGGNIEGSYEVLKAIQTALDAGEMDKVGKLRNKLVGEMDGYGNYLNFGEVRLDFDFKSVADYGRSLDVNNAIAYVRHQSSKVNFCRQYFASYPDRVIVAKIEASKKCLAFEVTFDNMQAGCDIVVEGDSIVARGAVGDNGLNYYAKLALVSDGNITASGKKLKVKDASYCELFLCAATDYASVFPTYRGAQPQPIVDKIVKNAIEKGFEKIKQDHTQDYKSLFDRVNFDLGASVPTVTTDKLIRDYKKKQNGNNARYYEEILYQYGRYLIIASSRKGALPANLQGVWNNSNNPAWGCDYHLNVNLQMCYWHAYVANLAETAEPMIEYMNSLREPGRVTAKIYHNIASNADTPNNGWVCHTQCTPFGWTCPGWEFDWGWSPAASSWMMQNCFDYYAFTEDEKMLKNVIYPMMKENAEFWLQNLIYEKSQDRWVSSPSYSPEHGPISVGNTYEQEMVFMLFDDTIKAAKVVGGQEEFIARLKEKMDKLAPLDVGKWGQIKEWYEEDEWTKDCKRNKVAYAAKGCQLHHRHASHLIALYPARHITQDTPELFEAAKVSLVDRGLSGKFMNISGWGKANKINMWARLKEGEQAYKLVGALLKGNIANNLWDLHPPFQMDGNCGYTSGVSEMLAYSDGNCIQLLPALPKVWNNGEVEGICARGNCSVNMTWKDGKVVQFTVFSNSKKSALVKVNGIEMRVAVNELVVL